MSKVGISGLFGIEFKEFEYYKLTWDKSIKSKLTLEITERILAYRLSCEKSTSSQSKKSTLHLFFKGNSELIKKVKKNNHNLLEQVVKESLGDYYAINPSLKKLIYKWCSFYYSMRMGDPRESLLGEQFSNEKYPEVDNYTNYMLSKEKKEDWEHLKPIISNEVQYSEYISAKKLEGGILFLCESNYPPVLISETIKKISSHLLVKLDILKTENDLDGDRIDSFISNKIDEFIDTPLFKDTPEFYRENLLNLFYNKYTSKAIYPRILSHWVEWLERHDLKRSVAILLCLIMIQTKLSKIITSYTISKWEKWINRLVIDLKHLKMFQASFWVWYKTISESSNFDMIYSSSQNALVISMKNSYSKIAKLYSDREKFMKNLDK